MSTPSHQKSSSIEATQQELESFLAEADGVNGESRKSGDLSGASITPAQVNTSTGQGAENALKQAAAATAGGGGKVKLSPYVIIPIWISISGTVILFNKYIFTTLEFEYPIFLTFYHMLFATIGTNLLKQFTGLLNGVNDIEMTRPLYLRTILPIGALFSMSLIFSNTAYLTLSVSFIQMLKAFMPVAVLLISFAVRIEQPNRVLFAIVVLISSGCAIAAYGELSFAMSGFIFQCSAIAVEAARLVLIQILLQGMKMDPLVSVYFYAPVCTAMIGFCLVFTEGLLPFQNFSRVGLPILLLNGTIAFSLNIASVFLIGSAGGLILTLAGVVKDILLIMISMTLFGTGVSLVQAFGYAIALGGLMLFKTQGQKK